MNNIDQLYKDRFENFEAPVSDGLWDKIENNPTWQKHLHRQKIKNLAFYSAMAIVAIGTCTALLLHNPHQTEVALLEQETTEEMISETPSTAIETSNKEVLTEQNTIVEENTIPEQEEIKTNIVTTSDLSDESPKLQVTNNVSGNNDVTVSPTTNTMTPAKTENTTSVKAETEPIQNTKSNNNKEIKNSEPTPTTPTPAHNETLNSLFSIPNAFTPNGDGLNDIFKPVTAAEIYNYQLDIFMPNGLRVFSSKNIEYGWNGEYQGSLQNGGTYIYIIKYKDTDGKEHIDKGQLLLMR